MYTTIDKFDIDDLITCTTDANAEKMSEESTRVAGCSMDGSHVQETQYVENFVAYNNTVGSADPIGKEKTYAVSNRFIIFFDCLKIYKMLIYLYIGC